jgi:protein subunit release factor A
MTKTTVATKTSEVQSALATVSVDKIKASVSRLQDRQVAIAAKIAKLESDAVMAATIASHPELVDQYREYVAANRVANKLERDASHPEAAEKIAAKADEQAQKVSKKIEVLQERLDSLLTASDPEMVMEITTDRATRARKHATSVLADLVKAGNSVGIDVTNIVK